MAKRVYILSEEMRSSQSGFWVEGTDIQYDTPMEYPLPLETTVLENDRPVTLRLLPNCGFLEKEEQIAKGYPANYQWREADRKQLTFIDARLELDDGRHKMAIAFLERTGWMKGNEHKRDRPTKTIYEPFDEELLFAREVNQEELINKAKNAVFGLSDKEVRDLYLLAVNTSNIDPSVSVNRMRKHLLNIAGVNPEFVLDGIKTMRDKAVLTLTKAIEYKIATLDIPGTLAMMNDASKDLVPVTKISEAGGRDAKFYKAVDYLLTEKGAPDLQAMQEKVTKYEQAMLVKE